MLLIFKKGVKILNKSTKLILDNFFKKKFRLSDFGRHVGIRLLDLIFFREKRDKREIKFLDQLNFIKKVVWKVKLNF